MPIKRKWILTLGILAMTPGLTEAKGPFSLPSLIKSSSETAATTPAAKSNQDVANEVAAALRQAQLTGNNINIEFKDGVLKLTGNILDARQKAIAEQYCMTVTEVKKVENQLVIMSPEANTIQQTAFEAPKQQMSVEQAGFEANSGQPIASPIQQVAGQVSSNKAKNQQVANNIAQALKQSGMAGYDIEVSYKDGVAQLDGMVAHPEQAMQAHHVVSQVSGVNTVNNQLQVAAPVAPAAFQPALGGPMGNGAPIPPMPGGSPMPPMGPMGGMYPPMPGPPAPMMGHPGPGPVSPVYNQPYLPEHAWPTTAAYPNSAAISYPQQYSASAFPYIGPFYPYPQVPLGWRSSTLEWDDGQWQLTFSPRTDRWWWFFNPKNWK